jgi:hypothetical protein
MTDTIFMEKEKKDWFKELFSEVPSEFPPTLRIQKGKTYRVTFGEERPRVVRGGFGKKTAVINVSLNEELRSLFVGSNVDLARQIWNMWKSKNHSLKDWTVEISKVKKEGRNWRYKVKIV